MTDSAIPRLFFDKGTVCLKDSGLLSVPKTISDDREKNILRAYGLDYKEIVEYLKQSNFDFVDDVPQYIPSHVLSIKNLELRDYQKKAISRWIDSSMRGCIVLPTGAGKTTVGIKAIEHVNSSTLIVVPTIDLMEQWTQNIEHYLNESTGSEKNQQLSENNLKIKIGNLGGGKEDIQPITVATYDSAYLRAPYFGNQFELVIFDEVHHLPAPGFRSIAEQVVAPYRLGLTATLEREDGMHELIPKLVGGVVFQIGSRPLSEKNYLADYEIERRQVSLTPTEQNEYDLNYSLFVNNLKKLGLRIPSMNNIRRLIMMSNRNKIAREGLLARNKANEIALNSQSKVTELKSILAQNRDSKTIIFTQNNKMVYQLSNRFLIPFITYKTGKDERTDVLNGFRSGRYNVIVTSKVLDEGIDVPDAEVGIILSGTGSGRELIQRLGRILRPKHNGKKAKLIEIVSRQTRETNTSAKRITALKKNTESSSDFTEEKIQ